MVSYWICIQDDNILSLVNFFCVCNDFLQFAQPIPLSPVASTTGSFVAFLPLFQTLLEPLHLDPLTPGMVVRTPDHDPYHQQYQPVTDIHCC